jgi:hypothetical protein
MHRLKTDRVRQVIVALLVALLLLAPAAPGSQTALAMAQSQTAQPCTRPEHFQNVPTLGSACRLPNGIWRVRLRDGSFTETHGPDSTTLHRPGVPTARLAAAPTTTCVYDLTNDYYGLMIYAYPSDGTNRFSTEEATLRTQLQGAQDLLTSEGLELGTKTSYKVACNADGSVRVVSAQLATPNASANFSTINSDLRALGYNNPNAKYWVWYDGYVPGACGIGTQYLDDSPNVGNPSNRGNIFAVAFGGCWSSHVIMHEAGHNMGAVQLSAPNSSGALHCNDGRDVMCYDDEGAGIYNPYVCTDKDEHFDCNHDDYFHTNPAAGSYLATHWNLGACYNRYINRSGCNSPELPLGSNLSQGKTATADSACATGNGAANAVDGLTTTKWCSNGASKWLQVDLGASARVMGFVVKHAGAGGESVDYNTRDFNIQLSSDGATWSTAVRFSGNVANTTSHRITDTTARYVRLNVTTPTQNADTTARIYELGVYGVPSLPGSLISQGKAATADSACATDQEAPFAVDGLNSTKWCSLGSSRWLQIDLGASASVSGFILKHSAAGGEPEEWNTRDFTIQLSPDGTTWSTPVNVTGNTASLTRHAITSVTARYVRLNVTTPTQNGDPAARIYELQVFGTFSGTPTPTSTTGPSPTPTRTPTPSPTPTPTVTPTPGSSGLKVQYQVGDPAAPSDNQIRPYLRIVNTGSSSVPLSELTIRYWYTRDTAVGQSASCDYFAPGCGTLTTSFAAVSPARTGADYYYQIGFTSGAGSLAAGATSNDIQTRFNKTDWSNFTETGDYSYDSTKTAFADWSKVTLYRNGVLVWGTEP